MEYKKNDLVTVKIEDIGTDGEGIGKTDGFTLFVKDAVIGDLVEAKILKSKKHYAYARLEKVITPSPFRTEPKCPYHRQCGGCQIQALSYEKQLEFKQNKIRNNLVRIGGFAEEFVDSVMEPIVGMEEPYHYRNKAQYPVGTDKEGNIVTGFYAGRTHSIIANTKCYLGAEENEGILNAVLDYMRENGVSAYDEETGEGLVRHILIRSGFTSGEIMVCLVINWRGGKDGKFGKAEKFEKAGIIGKAEKIEKFEKTGNIGSVTGGDRSCQAEKDCNLTLDMQEDRPVKTTSYKTGNEYLNDCNKYQNDRNKYQSDPNKYQNDRNKYQSDPSKYQSDSNKYQNDYNKYQREYEYLPKQEKLLKRLRQIPGVTSICVSINTEKTNVIMGKEIHCLWGRPAIQDTIHVRDMSAEGEKKGYPFTGEGLTFEISPLSFYQVNPKQTEKLYSLALEYAGLTGEETVWDLYCGIGTISLFLAAKAKKVYGVEIVPQAIEDARENAKRNGIENAEFFVGKAEEVLPEKYREDGIYADVIVVDPPRKGCDEECLDTMLQMRPERIVYVSCDSATLARDVRKLCDGGYEVVKVRGVDQFGMTVHVETVCLLERKP